MQHASRFCRAEKRGIDCAAHSNLIASYLPDKGFPSWSLPQSLAVILVRAKVLHQEFVEVLREST